MIHRTFEEILKTIASEMERKPKGLNRDEAVKWMLQQPKLVQAARMAEVYLTALRNPPEGVIGVGAITHAEKVLLENQQ